MSARKQQFLLLLVLYLSFVSLGLPDSILGTAWPQMRLSFGQGLEAAGILLSLTTVVSVFSSLGSGFAVRRLGTGPLIAVCAALTACAMFGYAFSPAWTFLLLFTLLFGLGQGAVDTAVNAYMAKNYSSRQMNWVHCCWGLGATGGPLIMGTAFALDFTWRSGYFAIGCVQLALAAIFLLSLRLWKLAPGKGGTPCADIGQDAGQAERAGCAQEKGEAGVDAAQGRLFAASAYGVLFYFLYPGIELVAGLWGASYLAEKAGATPASAAAAIALYWASLTVGRFLTGLIAGRVSNKNIIRSGIALAALGALLLLPAGLFGTGALSFLPDALSMQDNLLTLCRAGLLLVGLGLAPLYPTMMHDTPARVGNQAADRLVGMQVGAALAGAATIPALAGLLSGQLSLAIFAPVLLLFLLLTLTAHEGSLRASLLKRG